MKNSQSRQNSYLLHCDHNFDPHEFGQLAALARWGEAQDYTQERMAEHFAAVDFIAHVRDSNNTMVGYISAMANGLGSVFVDGMLTHPEYDGDTIGRLLINSVLNRFSNQPVYASPFVDEQKVFRDTGFKVYRREMIALANRNDMPVEPILTLRS